MARPGGHRDPAYLIDTIRRHGITAIHFVPSMLRAFLAEVRDTGARLPTLRRIVCSGEELTGDLVTEADELIGCEKPPTLTALTEGGGGGDRVAPPGG